MRTNRSRPSIVQIMWKWWQKRGWRLRAGVYAGLLSAALVGGLLYVGLTEASAYALAVALPFAVVFLWFAEGRRWLTSLDWRIGAILLATVASVLISLVIYATGQARDPGEFWGAVFAAWLGAVSFFVVVGAAVAIISLTKPEDEPFEARARILFRRETGPHIEYIISKINEVLEHYSEKTSNKIIILDYNETAGKYRIAFEGDSSVRGYIDDIDATYKSEVEYDEITEPPENGTKNTLVYFRINGEAQDISKSTSGNSIRYPFKATTKMKNALDIAFRVEVWLCASTEPISHTVARYTQLLSLHIENRLLHQTKVHITRGDSHNPDVVWVPPGEVRQPYTGSDLRTGATAYEIRIEPA